MASPRLAVLYEHPEWFKPLLAELDRRSIAFVPLYAGEWSYDPALRSFPYPLVLNRMSPSSYLRGHGQGIFFCREFLRYLQNAGVRVINGYDAYLMETSKCAQIEIFERLGLRYPRSRVVNHTSQVLEASTGLQFPVIIKPNIGGSGAKIQYFARREDLAGAVQAGTIELGIDHTALGSCQNGFFLTESSHRTTTQTSPTDCACQNASQNTSERGERRDTVSELLKTMWQVPDRLWTPIE